MSNEIAVSLQNVGKMYRMYPSRLDMALDATGLIRLFPWRKSKGKEYWALRNIDLEVKKGERLGIIGRNGAGKSTMLKLLTDNLRATEGSVYVNGTVQALLTSGSGFHPEFTGYENIRSSLVYQGLNPDQIEDAVKDIAEFTELGDFLSQPFKLYSAGMQARLSFATATVLNPNILIVDEILGAGDAYFAGKSLERMKNLVENSGATVLIVSHALDQILQYCNTCIWVERGKIVRHGPALEVIKAYQEFIHTLEDRRLKAENRQRLARDNASKQSGSYSDVLTLTFQVQGDGDATCDIAEISLLKNGKVEENLHVGDVQDTSRIHSAAICIENSHWSESRQMEGMSFRSLSLNRAATDVAQGNVIFDAYTVSDDAAYALQVRYRTHCTSKVSMSMVRNGVVIKDPVDLSSTDDKWVEWQTNLEQFNVPLKVPAKYDAKPGGTDDSARKDTLSITHWPGEGLLTIEQIQLLGPDGYEKAVFPVGGSMTVRLLFKAHSDNHFDVLPSIALYRLDGILVSKFPGKSVHLFLAAGETHEFNLEFESLNLGDGHYVFSAALFRDVIDERQRYDLVDRSYKFQMVENEAVMASAIFRHPSSWKYNVSG